MAIAREDDAEFRAAGARERPVAGERADRSDRSERVGPARAAEEPRDHLLAMLAHELRTPLHVVQMSNELMLRRARDQQEDLPPRSWWVAHLEKSHRTINRISQLMETILGMSQVTSGGALDIVTESVDLTALVHQIVARDQHEIRWAGCDCTVESPRQQIGRWDRARLDLVVSNLLSNALKYGRGKPVVIRLDGHETTLRLSVTDQGPGIPVQLQDRLFQRWSRLPGAGNAGGLGLGLWITREIVRAMKGDIRVISAAGQGATFCVELPRSS